MVEYLVQKMVEIIQKRDFLNVIMLWVQELTKMLIENQFMINYNVTSSFIESLKRLSEDFSPATPSQVKQIAKHSYDSLAQTFKFY